MTGAMYAAIAVSYTHLDVYKRQVQDSGSNRDFGTTKAAKMYFSLSNPGPNAFAGNEVTAPKFAK